MNVLLKNLKLKIFPIVLILILIFSRLIPHPPNFTPIIAAAVMSSYLFKNIYISLFILLTSMFLSDLIIGTHGNFFFVYFSLFLITIFCRKVIKHIDVKNLFLLWYISSSLNKVFIQKLRPIWGNNSWILYWKISGRFPYNHHVY